MNENKKLFNFKKFNVPMSILEPSDEETYTLIPGDTADFLEWAIAMYTSKDTKNPFEIHSGRDKAVKEKYFHNNAALRKLCEEMRRYYDATNGRFGAGPDHINKQWIEDHLNKPNDSTIYWTLTTYSGKLVKSRYTSESVKKFLIAMLNTSDFFDEYVNFDIDMNTVTDNKTNNASNA